MIALDRFHHCTSLGCGEGHPLALRHCQRSRVRPGDHHDGNADAVEPADVGDARDTYRPQQTANAVECLLRGADAMRVRLAKIGGLAPPPQ
jgi:hypothetical protein